MACDADLAVVMNNAVADAAAGLDADLTAAVPAYLAVLDNPFARAAPIFGRLAKPDKLLLTRCRARNKHQNQMPCIGPRSVTSNAALMKIPATQHTVNTNTTAQFSWPASERSAATSSTCEGGHEEESPWRQRTR